MAEAFPDRGPDLRGVRLRAVQQLLRPRQCFQEREQGNCGQAEHEGSGREGERERFPAPLPARPKELQDEVDPRRRHGVQEALGMSGRDHQEQGRAGQGGRAPVGVAGQAPQAEQEKREGPDRRRLRVSRQKDEKVREGPAAGADQRGERAAPELAKEEERREQRDQEAEGHVERPGLRQREQESDPGPRMEDARELRRQQRRSGEHESVPQRPMPVLDRVAHGLAPRETLVGDVGKQRRLGLSDPGLRAVRRERLAVVDDVDRGVEPPGDEGLSRQKARRQSEEERDAPREGAHKPVREPEDRRRRTPVDRDQTQGQERHARAILRPLEFRGPLRSRRPPRSSRGPSGRGLPRPRGSAACWSASGAG